MLIINNCYIVMARYKMQTLLICSQIILANKLMKSKERKEDNKLIRIRHNKCHKNLFLHKLQLLNNFRGNKINKFKDFIKINIYLLYRINFNKINPIINKMGNNNGYKILKLNGYLTMTFIMKLVNLILNLVFSKKLQMNQMDLL